MPKVHSVATVKLRVCVDREWQCEQKGKKPDGRCAQQERGQRRRCFIFLYEANQPSLLRVPAFSTVEAPTPSIAPRQVPRSPVRTAEVLGCEACDLLCLSARRQVRANRAAAYRIITVCCRQGAGKAQGGGEKRGGTPVISRASQPNEGSCCRGTRRAHGGDRHS